MRKSESIHSHPAVPSQHISRRLIRWFAANKRDLPYRNTTDAYRIWISEVMLQQTTVAAVGPFYERFIEKFPTVRKLARAADQDVLTAWAGLGYYRRAKLLHAAAKQIVAHHGGVLPGDVLELEKLPGFGKYTAGAVASFAFGVPAPIVEANSARVLARLFMVEEIESSASRARLWDLAAHLVPQNNARDHNYAIMELGSLVCRPVRPDCPRCPLLRYCAAYAAGRAAEISALKPRREKVEKRFACVVASQADHYAVRQIPDGEWHAGMFEFPKIACTNGTHASPATFKSEYPELAHVTALRPLHELRYTVTHHSVTLAVYRASLKNGNHGSVSAARKGSKKGLPGRTLRWMKLQDIARLPMGAAQRRLLKLLMNEQTIQIREA